MPFFVLAQVPPPLVARVTTEPEQAGRRRTRIWEFSANLHCSIIGTCLSTAELRQVVAKSGLFSPGATEHDLHKQGVTIAGRHDGAGKLLNKALDQRHRLIIARFDKADDAASVRALWREFVAQGEIPGAYWAALSHPAATRELVADAFGEVHMLSHLVGAANRADVRRLVVLEMENAALQERLARQQAQLHKAVVDRDATIQELRRALAGRIAAEEAQAPSAAACEAVTLRGLIADLERRLSAEASRRARVEARLSAAEADVAEARAGRAAAEHESRTLREELAAMEAALHQADDMDAARPASTMPRLDGRVLLYVGGRPAQVAHLRAIAERLGAELLHHDGGIEDSPDLLAGLACRSDLVLFPVDCVSHEAALAVKRLCRQAGKRFLPLRASGIGSFVAAVAAVA